MRIDEAISLLKQYIDYDNPDIPDFYTMAEACEVVIKALEQQPTDAVDRATIKEYLYSLGMGIMVTTTDDVLDKIRSEVTAIAINGQVDDHTLFIRTGEQVKQMVLEIIDKYIAEGSKE